MAATASGNATLATDKEATSVTDTGVCTARKVLSTEDIVMAATAGVDALMAAKVGSADGDVFVAASDANAVTTRDDVAMTTNKGSEAALTVVIRGNT
ncbi:hypothetical protein E2562_033526 [Oryza meyeriana var. granulata]|uniref:Uncharacterized protein n=1 Tax=Oryza meyeriana var. granulata TaxID=110450 RepID=A0A6G1CM09_9ORYZ|nr:hypothetical protein E2562_033526 [Oryza meyeriana var. granulata]